VAATDRQQEDEKVRYFCPHGKKGNQRHPMLLVDDHNSGKPKRYDHNEEINELKNLQEVQRETVLVFAHDISPIVISRLLMGMCS
jgi:hypothetical protein